MTNKEEIKKNHTSEPLQEGEGRTHNSQQPAFEQTAANPDISEIDQQEGNMNNGETGGSGLGSDES